VRGTVLSGTLPPSDVDEALTITGLDDVRGLAAAAAGASAIVHLAARVHVMRDRAADPLADYRRVNVEGTRAVLEAAATTGVRRFVFVSSVKAVGEATEVPWSDDETPAPVDPYGISKLEAERLALETSPGLGVETVVLRLPLAYGAGVRGNMLRLLQLVDRGVPLPFGGLANRRSLVFAGNVAWAIGQVLATAGIAGRTFFLSDGEDLSTPELIRRIAMALGRPARLVSIRPALFAAAGLVGDALARFGPFPLSSAVARRLTGSLLVDASGFARVAGAMPFSVDEGLAETARWFRGARAE
jgi:nucleoside-diphosphate-sugar epimerase